MVATTGFTSFLLLLPPWKKALFGGGGAFGGPAFLGGINDVEQVNLKKTI
jgi:hypothetical protein